MKPRILIILHQEHSTPGRIGQRLEERGFELDARKPRFGDPLPETMDEHEAAIIFGGPMSANDPDPFIRQEIDWIGVPLSENKPFLGVCLGAQMLAIHLGAKVEKHPHECVEIGYYGLQPTEEGEGLLPWPKTVYQWHTEGFDVPEGAKLLARGKMFSNQAFLYGEKAWGIQFHPELTLAMLHRWTTRGAPRLESPGAQARGEHFRARFVHDAEKSRWLNAFLDLWIGRAPFDICGQPVHGSRAKVASGH